MARIQDVINNLDPDTASQVIEALRNPSATAEGILSAIRNFDVSDATDAVKSFIEEKTTPSNIVSQAGDFALEQANLPISMSDVQNIASAAKSEGITGALGAGADIALGLNKVYNMQLMRAFQLLPLFNFQIYPE